MSNDQKDKITKAAKMLSQMQERDIDLVMAGCKIGEAMAASKATKEQPKSK